MISWVGWSHTLDQLDKLGTIRKRNQTHSRRQNEANEASGTLKTINFKTFTAIIFVCFAMVACVQDDDFTVPSSVGSEENENLNALLQSIDQNNVQLVSVEYVKGLYNGQVTLIESDIAVKGYVSSSDATGNFYKEF